MAEPISVSGITLAVLGAVFSGASAYEYATRKKNLKDIGQNDITESDCTALCEQIRTRWNELCLAQSDEKYMKERWTAAAAAAAAAALVAAALAAAGGVSAATIVGLPISLGLSAAAAIAVVAATAAAGFASSAFLGWLEAETKLNSARGAFASAREQMREHCTGEQTQNCVDALPDCV